jgi:hypothetical protein
MIAAIITMTNAMPINGSAATNMLAPFQLLGGTTLMRGTMRGKEASQRDET